VFPHRLLHRVNFQEMLILFPSPLGVDKGPDTLLLSEGVCVCVCVCLCVSVCVCGIEANGLMKVKQRKDITAFLTWSIIHVCAQLLSCVQHFCGPVGCSPPDFSVHGIFRARILKWVAISSSRSSSQPRDHTCVSWVSYIGRWTLYHCATWKPLVYYRGSNVC